MTHSCPSRRSAVLAGASVSVGGPRLVSGLQALAAESRVVHVAGRFQPRWLDPMFLVVAATDDAVGNRAVADAARERRLLGNVVDDTAPTSFPDPTRLEPGPLQVQLLRGRRAPARDGRRRATRRKTTGRE